MKSKQSDEFADFDKVMTRLLSVPYSELQKQLKAENKAKAEKKKRSKTASSRAASSRTKRAT